MLNLNLYHFLLYWRTRNEQRNEAYQEKLKF